MRNIFHLPGRQHPEAPTPDTSSDTSELTDQIPGQPAETADSTGVIPAKLAPPEKPAPGSDEPASREGGHHWVSPLKLDIENVQKQLRRARSRQSPTQNSGNGLPNRDK